MSLFTLGVEAVERGLVPDAVTRLAVRRLCRQRLHESAALTNGAGSAAEAAFRESLHSGPIAPVPEKANQQHYELPAEFFAAILGPRRKYSCCYWPAGATSLAAAEDAALERTCQQAGLADGQDVLELGCGWGSLTLWMAHHYPASRITAVSNSHSQRRFIEAEASAGGLTNVRVITADMNDFSPAGNGTPAAGFDRIVSVEMFEHMRNYECLLRRIACWLRPGGQLFVHVFCHARLAYPFESAGSDNWMGRYFFTGGIMPSADLLSRFDRDLRVAQQWNWNGLHYRRTAEAWLANLDRRRDAVLDILAAAYGPAHARRWFHRWRMFFLAVAELFGFDNGRQWHVAQYSMQHAATRPA